MNDVAPNTGEPFARRARFRVICREPHGISRADEPLRHAARASWLTRCHPALVVRKRMPRMDGGLDERPA